MATKTTTLIDRKPAGGRLAHAMRDWRCQCCNRLLGRRGDGRVHLRTTRGTEYFAAYPLTAVCRCGRLNEINR